MLFKQCLKLRHVLQDDRYGHASGTHDAQNLVKVIRQRNIGKFVHDEMAVDGQASPVLVVGKIEKLLEKLRV